MIGFLRSWAFGAVLLCLATLHSAAAEADGLSRSDKLRVLYSNQFAFDRRGVPLITIGIIDGADEVTLRSTEGMRVLPDGEDGSEVRGGTRWRIRLQRSTPATIEHHVVLTRQRPDRIRALQQQMAQWRRRGVKTQIIEVGTIFGIKGRVFDSRGLLLVSAPVETSRGAKKQAERFFAQGWVSKVRTIRRLKKRPSARLEALDLQQGTRIFVSDAIWFAPSNPRAQLSVSGGGKGLRAHGGSQKNRYRGQIYVTVDRLGKLAVVNAVPADKLLAGLVPAEIFPSAPSAALRAQAVAARSDLLSKIGTRHFVDPYLICAWQHCQVYRGVGHEHPRCTNAVKATRGMVLARKAGGGLVNAVYHANSGGHTEDNEVAWPGAPDPTLRGKRDGHGSMMASFRGGITEKNISRWLAIRPDSWGARSGVNKDKVRWTVRRAARAISLKLRHLGLGPIQAITVLSRGRSGRANLVRVSGARKAATIRGELTIRRAFGNLRSSMFVVRAIKDARNQVHAFEFRGGGWGHGVGMCQSGAIGMAKGGRSHSDILQHYYSATELRRVY